MSELDIPPKAKTPITLEGMRELAFAYLEGLLIGRITPTEANVASKLCANIVMSIRVENQIAPPLKQLGHSKPRKQRLLTHG